MAKKWKSTDNFMAIRKKTKQSQLETQSKPSYPPEFREWWKEHRYSGYAVNHRGEQRFGISPLLAWGTWKYKAEFFAENSDAFPWPEGLERPEFEDIEKWALEQQTTEERTKALEKRLGKEFWKHMAPDVWYAEFKKIGHELVKHQRSFDPAFDVLVCRLTRSMKEKIENAYAYEPGQSEEETALLSRRRET